MNHLINKPEGCYRREEHEPYGCVPHKPNRKDTGRENRESVEEYCKDFRRRVICSDGERTEEHATKGIKTPDGSETDDHFCTLPHARLILYRLARTSVLCSAESLSPFPCVINTTFRKIIHIRWCCIDQLR